MIRGIPKLGAVKVSGHTSHQLRVPSLNWSLICKKVFPWSILRGGEPDFPCILRQLFLTGSHQKPLLEGRPRRGAPLWVSRGCPGGSQPQQSPCILSCLCQLLFTPDPAHSAQPRLKSQIRRTAGQAGAPVSLEIYYLTTNEGNGGIFIRGLWGFSIIVLPWTRASWQGLWSTVSVVFLCSVPVFFCSHFLLYLSTYCSLSLIYLFLSKKHMHIAEKNQIVPKAL